MSKLVSDVDGYCDWADDEIVYRFEEYLPPSVRDWIRAKWEEVRELLIDNGIIPRSEEHTAAAESQPVVDARNALQSAKSDLDRLNRDVENHRSDLDKDYGPDSVLRALRGKEIALDSGEYTYKLLWGDKTVQNSKKSHGDTNMGNFKRVETGADGSVKLIFEDGQGCWQGPARSTTVYLTCSAEEEITNVSEEEKCVYRMDVRTSAVCLEETKKAQSDVKEDL
jgi:protein kinase C substrate 80K-H